MLSTRLYSCWKRFPHNKGQKNSIGLLHDVGKVGIPKAVLNKPGKLTDEEYDVIKEHTTKGHEVLKDISAVPELAVGALSHHERHDGKGYPNGLSGNDIPEVARIIAVADSFEPNRRPVGDSLPKLLTILKTASCQGGLFCLPSCC